jgi:hypothetical protein
MDEFRLSAFALYPDSRSGDVFAEVCERSLAACFGAMADEVADWLPRALARGEGTEPPRAIELTLEWSGAPAPAPAPERPVAPSDPARRQPRLPRGVLPCTARRRYACSAVPALPTLRSAAAELLGAGAA